jgi:hypothetical protein
MRSSSSAQQPSLDPGSCRALGQGPQMSSLPRMVILDIFWQRPQFVVAHSALLCLNRLPIEKPRRGLDPDGAVIVDGTGLRLLDDLAHSVHGLADAAADVALSLLGLAFGFQMAIACHLASLLFDRAGCFLQAALNPLPSIAYS